ncbi:FRG domain-containing protein [Marinicella litoralis]|uniref:FRG domain-containing protein n=1 Tax=Marinicella litoralis TaxID=644220 RepID=A0A4R6XEV2_9GAMM|nr:FRG domain-containing protein [Marinicella litoralis]TDR16749.1 FRG domain-containing protein [Marinicella litoralis]
MNDSDQIYPTRDIHHYKNLTSWPEFTIYDKTIDGLIPSTRLDNWEDFHSVVKSYRNDEEGAEYIYRGQHNFKWELQPSLDRLISGAIKEEFAKKQIRNFKLSIRGRVPDNAILHEQEEELWAIGQHHGLATPLLDWTMAPYVALFFAFVNEDPDSWVDKDGNPTNYSRSIYILNKSFIEDLIEDEYTDPLVDGYPKIVEPSKDDHGRLVNQAGLFTQAPYGETIESAVLRALVDSEVDVDDPTEVSKYICKLHLPNSKEIRRDCLLHLRKMNIHHASLFPDVIGASGYCNDLISEYIEKHKSSSTNTIKNNVIIENRNSNEIVSKDKVRKEYVINETNKILKKLISSLLVIDNVEKSVNESQLKTVSKKALEFIEEKAGVDWYVRDSQISRLKNIIRRNLKRVAYPDDFISEAAHSLAHEIAKMSFEKERDSKVSQSSTFKRVWGSTEA